MFEKDIIREVEELNQWDMLRLYMRYFILMKALNLQLSSDVSQHPTYSFEEFCNTSTYTNYGDQGYQYDLKGIYYYYRLFNYTII